MTQIYIPQYRLVDEPPGKPHYVYIVEVIDSGRLQKVERRYSAFHCLHRELQMVDNIYLKVPWRVAGKVVAKGPEEGDVFDNIAGNVCWATARYTWNKQDSLTQDICGLTWFLNALRKHFTTPLFPPKRVRSCQRKVLERRRQCLEQYLQAMLRFGPSRAQVFAFLGIQRPNDELENVDDVVTAPTIEHQAVYTYKNDPYLEAEVCSSLPDVVTQGVLSGLYDSWK